MCASRQSFSNTDRGYEKNNYLRNILCDMPSFNTCKEKKFQVQSTTGVLERMWITNVMFREHTAGTFELCKYFFNIVQTSYITNR